MHREGHHKNLLRFEGLPKDSRQPCLVIYFASTNLITTTILQFLHKIYIEAYGCSLTMLVSLSTCIYSKYYIRCLLENMHVLLCECIIF